ncbi:UDP-2,3-diacylglucosamine diphosphatase [Comamonadaceae bacterium M7527]|nr:UDP-2,3-diacylglucosamine diphosphatase [Comamonadaceae bacterium M7527]
MNTITAPSAWQRVDLVSDLHLQASTQHTALAWHHYLAQASCDALFILGDFFEVWVGDDVLSPNASNTLSQTDQDNALFWQHCTAELLAASRRFPIYMIVGNRDFLLGPSFFKASGVLPLDEETTLDWHGTRYLLAHGDHWCTDDHDYQAFRSQVRTPAWQLEFLSQSLASRMAIAANMRQQSSQRMRTLSVLPDVNEHALLASAAAVEASHVIHGHTHTGLDHLMAGGVRRSVLSDWDCEPVATASAVSHPKRAQVLRLERAPANGFVAGTPRRIEL